MLTFLMCSCQDLEELLSDRNRFVLMTNLPLLLAMLAGSIKADESFTTGTHPAVGCS